jgi:hypothetical protein
MQVFSALGGKSSFGRSIDKTQFSSRRSKTSSNSTTCWIDRCPEVSLGWNPRLMHAHTCNYSFCATVIKDTAKASNNDFSGSPEVRSATSPNRDSSYRLRTPLYLTRAKRAQGTPQNRTASFSLFEGLGSAHYLATGWPVALLDLFTIPLAQPRKASWSPGRR